jgi:hypothetical protein
MESVREILLVLQDFIKIKDNVSHVHRIVRNVNHKISVERVSLGSKLIKWNMTVFHIHIVFKFVVMGKDSSSIVMMETKEMVTDAILNVKLRKIGIVKEDQVLKLVHVLPICLQDHLSH